jgi:hypothetical protein
MDNGGFQEKSLVTVVVGVLLIIILVTASLFIYYNSQPPIPTPLIKNTFHSVDIHNKTKLPYTVTLPSSQKIEIDASDTLRAAVSNGDIITAVARHFDGTPIQYSYPYLDPSVTDIFIGNSGIFTNKNVSEETQFVNDSPFPVMFIEKSTRGGRRWASDIIPPKMHASNQFVTQGSIWQVVHPTEERRPIAEISIGNIVPKKIIFNGKTLLLSASI